MEQTSKMKISKELKFIIELLKNQVNDFNLLKIKSYSTEMYSWNRFVSLVIKHRLVSVIYTSLQNLEVEIPKEEAERLKYHFELERKKNFILNVSLINLNDALEREVRVLWFKGVVQSQRMYGNPLLRSYSDLDVLIDQNDLYKVDEILRKEGYFPINDWTKYSKSHFSKYSEIIKEIGYVNHKTKVFIDLHWNLVFAKQLFPYTFDEIYESSIELELHSKKVRSLGELHNFIYLNLHGCFDDWKNLSQLLDIQVSVNKEPVLKNKYIEFLKYHRLSDSLADGINLSEFIFSEKHLSNQTCINHISQFEYAEEFEKQQKFLRIHRLIRVSKFNSSLSYKIISLEANVFYGDNKDLWRLPRSLFFLYYISVPFRWLGRKISRKKSLS